MRRLACALLTLILGACVEFFPVVNQDGLVQVEVEVLPGSGTRSSVCPDEAKIGDLVVLVYGRGRLHSVHALNGAGLSDLTLYAGETYSFYALANAGTVSPDLLESDFLESFRFDTSDLGELESGIPMAGMTGPVLVSEGMSPVCIQLQRLFAKVSLTIDKSALEGLEVNSVRVCQCASSVYPFKDFGHGGSKAVAPEGVHDGDYASAEDLAELKTGGAVHFYVPENCQGILLPDNDDPWMKIPWKMGDAASVATYIEVKCGFVQSAVYEGDMTCRFYLGNDNCRDFNVRRNMILDVMLTLTEDAVRKVSWKVESDVDSLLEFTEFSADIGEYVYEYSCLEFPSASKDFPVVLASCGGSMVINGEPVVKTLAGYDSRGRQNSFFIVTPDDPRKVYFQMFYPDETVSITLERDMKCKTLTCVPKPVGLALHSENSSQENCLSVNESGLELEDAYVYLQDAISSAVIPLRRFFYPEGLAKYYGEVPEYPVLDASVTVIDSGGREYGRSYSYRMSGSGLEEGEEYLCKMEFYGLDSDGLDMKELELELHEENSFWTLPVENVSLGIEAAFPSQSFLGEYENLQFAPGDMRSMTVDLSGLKKGVTAGAVWELRRIGLPDPSRIPDKALWESGSACAAGVSSYGGLKLLLKSMYHGYEEVLPYGAMMLKGVVVNPFTGREICGYYTFDLVLVLSVGVQVDIEEYDMYYSFVPFCEWAVPAYMDFWNEVLGSRFMIRASRHYGGGFYDVNVALAVPASVDYNTMHYTLPVAFSSSGQDSLAEDILKVLEPLKAVLMDFDFVVSAGVLRRCLDVTRNGGGDMPGYAGFADGSEGYLRLVRQQDLNNLPGSSGLENHVIEAAFGSFEKY